MLKLLVLKDLLSEEQHLELNKALLEDELDSSRIVDVIKGTKVGQGFKFLQRKLNNLLKGLEIWIEDLAETGRSAVRSKVGAVLEELLRRNGISHEKHTSIKENIL